MQRKVTAWLIVLVVLVAACRSTGAAALSYEILKAEGAALDSFSVPLLLENEVGNPYYVVLTFGVHPDGTDEYDTGLDQWLPPAPPVGRDFEAYFLYDHPALSKLVRDIRSNEATRLIWTIITKGAEGTMTWYPSTFPRKGTFILNGVVNMRQITTTEFAYRDTMTVTYNSPEAVPDIYVELTSYDFGQVLLSDTSFWDVRIHNSGGGDLIVDSVSSDRPEFVVVQLAPPQMIAPLGSLKATLCFVPAALGPVAGNVTIFSNDPDESMSFIALVGTGVNPEIEVASLRHNFGQVVIGDSAGWRLVVLNQGTGDLTIDGIISDSPDFSAHPTSFSVGSADSEEVDVRFAPSSAGPVSAQLTVMSNDFDEPTISILLAGIGIGPHIEVSATHHDFGSVRVGDSALWSLTVRDTGLVELLVDTITCSSPYFFATPRKFTVPPGGAQEVRVSFYPSAVGRVEGFIEIVSTDPHNPVLTVTLAGTGAGASIYVAEREHNFGAVRVGQSVVWDFDVINLGATHLEVSSVESDHRFFSAEPTAFIISPSNIQAVCVTFAPTAVGSVFAQLTIFSSDPIEPTVGISLSGRGLPETGVEEPLLGFAPGSFHLYQNAPNPFNPTTSIQYSVISDPTPSHVTLTIFNLLGQKVRTLVDEVKRPGYYSVIWDGRDDCGQPVGSGIYCCTLQAGDFTQTRKTILLK